MMTATTTTMKPIKQDSQGRSISRIATFTTLLCVFVQVEQLHAFMLPSSSRCRFSTRDGTDKRLFSFVDDQATVTGTANTTASGMATTIFDTTTTLPASNAAQFGEVVSLKGPRNENSVDMIDDEDNDALKVLKMKRRNFIVAVASIALALLNYSWEYTHPITPIQLLATMEQQSASITTIGTNSKPTVVDFWAPWCENCKVIAPTLQKVEEEYAGKVNFVMVNGDRPEAWPLIERFGVDAIPHLALISADGDVETALIGPVPKSVLERDLDVLLSNAAAQNGDVSSVQQPLPYQMLDVFANRPDLRRIKFNLD